MSRFGNIRQQQVTTDKSVVFYFDFLEGRPGLRVVAGTAHNKPLQAFLTRQAAFLAKIRKQSDMTDDEKLEVVKKGYASHVIRGFVDVLDSEGNVPEDTVENFKDFLDALDPIMFSELVNFCSDYTNFVPDAMTTEEISDMAGN